MLLGSSEAMLQFRADGTFTYTPPPDFNGVDTFTYRAIDAKGARSEDATVTITVTSVNDDPVATPDQYTINEDETLAGTSVLAGDADDHHGAPDENNLPLVAELASGTSHGVLNLNPDGTFTIRRSGISAEPTAEFYRGISRGREDPPHCTQPRHRCRAGGRA